MTTKGVLRVYDPEEKKRILAECEQSGLTIRAYAESIGVLVDTIVGRLRTKREGRDPTARSKRGAYTPDQRKQAVEACLKSGMTQNGFAPTWGVSHGTLSSWIRQYQKHGSRGFESQSFKENPRKRGPKGIPSAVKREIVRT